VQYLVMELVEGETLEEKLKNGALPVEDALPLALQIAEALEAAHEKGVVHRDLKPANVMVTNDGQVKVLDFGLAKAFSGDPNQAVAAHSPALSAAMTQQGLILGTAGYMSPEQASGQATDQRADIWAFGVLLYEMLTGMPVFRGESVPHILADVLRTEPDWSRLPKNLHTRLKLLLERCLKKRVRDRYHSIADVRVEIEDLLRDPHGGAVVTSTGGPLWRRAWPVAAALVLGMLLASAYFVTRKPPATAADVPRSLPESRFMITPPASAPLADLSGLDLTISPDGQRLAYFARTPETGNVELYVRELDALDARPIPGTEVSAANGTMNPFFSADGRSVGFWAPGRGIVRVSVDGSPAIKVLDSPSPAFVGATWLADDTMIYSNGLRLQRVSMSGGGMPEPLTPERTDNGVAAAPVLLPGGHALLFHEFNGSSERVAALDLKTGETKTVVEGGANPTYVDTGHVVFVRGTTLMAVPFDAAELAVTGRPVALVQGIRHPGPRAAADYALSANGTLAYVPTSADTVPSGSAIVWVDRTGKVVGRAVSGLVENPHDPVLSPEGTRLLLVTGGGDLWSYDLGGRPPLPLALGDNAVSSVWSPDGKRVAFASVRGQTADVFTLPADGSVLMPQPLRAGIGWPKVWSAAGELILTTTLLDADIAAVPVAAAGEPRKVVASEYAEYDPALSPDGRWLAYVSTRTGQSEIWVQGYPAGVPLRVSTHGGFEPQWSADGHELFYLQDNAMWAVAVETEHDFSFAAPTRLFSGPYAFLQEPWASSYAVARDGRFLMIEPAPTESGAPPANIVVVQNWTEELKKRVPHK
jgi:Tol biopolymer transport system component